MAIYDSMGELFLAMLGRIVEQRSRRVVLLKWGEVEEGGIVKVGKRAVMMQFRQIQWTDRMENGNKGKKLELSLMASDKALSTAAMFWE